MTPKQQKVLNFVTEFIRTHKRSPTFDQIRIAIGGKHISGAHRRMLALEDQGYLTWTRGVACSIELKEPPQDRMSEMEWMIEDLKRRIDLLEH